LYGLREQIDHLLADDLIRFADAGRVEIAPDLAEDVFVARLLEICDHHLLGIGFGLVAALAELFRRPEAEQLVAARRCLELQLLITDEHSLEGFFTFFHAAHGLPSDQALPRAARPRDRWI